MGARAEPACELACEWPWETLWTLVLPTPFQVHSAPLPQGSRLSLEMRVLCATVMWQLQRPTVILKPNDFKNQASLFFFKLLLKNQGDTLYFSEKPLLIPVSRRTSCEVRAAGRRHSRDPHPKAWVEKGWSLTNEGCGRHLPLVLRMFFSQT